MTQARLFEIPAGHWSENDLGWLNKLRESSCRGLDIRGLAMEIANRVVKVFRIEGDNVEGLWMTALYEHETGREYCINGLAGVLTVEAFNDLLVEHEQMGKKFHARWITARVENPRIQRILERKFGFRTVAVELRKEIPGGLH